MMLSEWWSVGVLAVLSLPKVIVFGRSSVTSHTPFVEAWARNGGSHAASVDHFVAWMRSAS
jgi:hypothetical protein